MTVKNTPAKVRINNVDTIVELNDTETLTNKTLTLPVINGIKESWTVSASAIGASPTLNVSSGTAFLYPVVTTTNWTPNFTSVNSSLAVNGSISQSQIQDLNK